MARYYSKQTLLDMKDKDMNCVYDLTDLEEYFAGVPAADVVPRAEVEKWYHEYHIIKDKLRQEKMYHRETEKLADKYCAELQSAKTDTAREIFAEIEKLISRYRYDEWYTVPDLASDVEMLKRKYEEGEK